MDKRRFDGITCALATGQTRRQALQGLAGGTLAGCQRSHSSRASHRQQG